MKNLTALLSCIFICTAAYSQPADQKTEWKKQYDSAFHFSFEYPDNWQLKLPGTNTRFFVTSYPENDSDGFRENINCITRQLEDTGFAIKSAEAAIKEGLAAKFGNFKLVKSGYIKWNNTDALCIEYTCLQKTGDEELDTHIYQQIANVRGLLFTLTYSAESKGYSKYEAVIKKIIRSVKVTK